MLRANFFYKFFKYKKNTSNEIVKYNSNERFDLQDKIYVEILDIDKKISQNSKAIFQSQIVKFKYNFSRSNNFLHQIGKNIYIKKIDESIEWHQKQLKELYIRRKELQINLEKYKGVYWLNQIKRFLAIVLIGFFIFIGVLIFLSGFMIIIYLLPLILLVLVFNLIANKKY